MGTLFLYELRKLIRQRYLVFFIILLLGVNLFNIYLNYDALLSPQQYVKDGETFALTPLRLQMDRDYEGKITNVKLARLKAHRNAAEAIFSGGDDGNETMYTPYPYSDMNFAGEIITEMQRLYTYHDTVIGAVLQKNAALKAQAQTVNDSFRLRQAQLIEKTYTGRSLDSYYRVNAFETVFSYRLSALFLVLLSVYSAAFLFAGEKENGMLPLLKCTPKKRVLFAAKAAAFFTFVSGVGILFFSADLLMFWLCLRPSGFLQPFYAIEGYTYSVLNVNVVTAYLLTSFLRVLGAFLIGCAVMLLSVLLPKAWHAFFGGALLTAALMAISLFTDGVFGALRFFDPVTLLISIRLFETFRVVNVLGHPVFMYVVALFGSLLFGAFSLTGTWLVYKRRRGYA